MKGMEGSRGRDQPPQGGVGAVGAVATASSVGSGTCRCSTARLHRISLLIIVYGCSDLGSRYFTQISNFKSRIDRRQLQKSDVGEANKPSCSPLLTSSLAVLQSADREIVTK